jgi:hypothetical protein
MLHCYQGNNRSRTCTPPNQSHPIRCYWLLQAGPCPTNFCKAAFNADDCCKEASYFPRFNLGAKCQWRNTPVSFTYEGMCEANGKAHMLLRSSNSQGAGTNLCRCQVSAGPAKVRPWGSLQHVPYSGFVHGRRWWCSGVRGTCKQRQIKAHAKAWPNKCIACQQGSAGHLQSMRTCAGKWLANSSILMCPCA